MKIKLENIIGYDEDYNIDGTIINNNLIELHNIIDNVDIEIKFLIKDFLYNYIRYCKPFYGANNNECYEYTIEEYKSRCKNYDGDINYLYSRIASHLPIHIKDHYKLETKKSLKKCEKNTYDMAFNEYKFYTDSLATYKKIKDHMEQGKDIKGVSLKSYHSTKHTCNIIKK